MNPELKVTISQDVVTDLIRAAAVEALGNREAILAAVVKEAMTAKANSYDKETVFQRQVGEMIRQAAKEVFKEWLDTKRELIRDAIRKRLTDEDGLPEKVAEQIVNGLASSFYFSASMKVEE